MSKPSVLIAIPAYNEELSIKQLIKSLRAQKTGSFDIQAIEVISDASSDETDEIVSSYDSNFVRLHRNLTRQGKPKSIQALFERATASVVLVLDADVQVTEKDFVAKLIEPILNGTAHLTAARVESLPPHTFVERILNLSTQIKNSVFISYKRGNHLYTCHGRAMAYSQVLYSQLKLPNTVLADDAYAYLQSKELGLAYAFVPTAVVKYRLPTSLSDHLLQSQRYFQSQTQLNQFFNPALVAKEYTLPRYSILKSTIIHGVKYPLLVVGYVLIMALSKVRALTGATSSSRWQIATSSKKI